MSKLALTPIIQDKTVTDWGMVDRIRLMNVGTVLATINGSGCKFELRPDAISIDGPVLTMIRVLPYDDQPDQISPILLARYECPAGWRVVDPIMHGRDADSWLIQSIEPSPITFSAMPYRGEYIWCDPGFADSGAGRSMRNLYKELTCVRIAHVAEMRWARTATDNRHKQRHESYVKALAEQIDKLQDEIAAKLGNRKKAGVSR